MTLFDKTNTYHNNTITKDLISTETRKKNMIKSAEENLQILIEIDDMNNIIHSKEISNLYVLQAKQNSIFNIKDLKFFKEGVSYLIDLTIEHHFSIETLSSSVYFFKKIITQCNITEKNFKAAVSSIFYLRAKYEELTVPVIEEVAYKVRTPVDKFITLESKILNLFQYDLNFVSGINFIRYLTKMNFYNQRDHKLSKFIFTLSLYCNLSYSEAEIATGSYFLSLNILNRNSDWIFLYSKCSKNKIIEVKNFLMDFLCKEILLKNFKSFSIYKMFNNKQNFFVSKFLYDFLQKLKNKQ